MNNNNKSVVNFMFALENYDLTEWIRVEFINPDLEQHMTEKLRVHGPYDFFFSLDAHYKNKLITHVAENYIAFEDFHISNSDKVQEALTVLTENGYGVENPWTAEDVTTDFECSDKVAVDVLNEVLSSDFVSDAIRNGISDTAASMGLKLTEDQYINDFGANDA